MSTQEEIQRLRRDLEGVVRTVADMTRRLDSLEKCDMPEDVPDGVRVTAPELPKACGFDRLESSQLKRPQRETDQGAPPSCAPYPGLWSWLSNGPAGGVVRGWFSELRSRTREQGWEILLGTYMLSRIAVACIAIAVVFFLTLAIDRWGATWMPHLRVGIGYAVSVALLGLAWRFESRHTSLSQVMYGGGFAIMYFVTFATHYVSFAQVFPSSPVPTLLLLTLVVLVWAVAAHLRRSSVIATLVTVLGHFTVLLSSLTMSTPGAYSMTGLVALSVGSAFFMRNDRWYYVGFLGLLGSYCNAFVALAHGRADNPYFDFVGAMGVLSFFFVIFAVAELFSPESLRRKAIPGWVRNAFVAVNTIAFLFLGTGVMSSFGFSRDHQDIFRFAVAGALLVIALGYLRFRAKDPLYNVYLMKSVSVFTLAIATRYGGNVLSVLLAVEMVALLVSARKSGLLVMRLLAFGVGGLAFTQSLAVAYQTRYQYALWDSLNHYNPEAYWTPSVFTELFRAALGVTAFLLASQLYQRTDWSQRSPRSAPFAPRWLIRLWQLDLISECPSGCASIGKLFNGLLFPHLYAMAGSLLFLAYTLALGRTGHHFGILSIFVLTMTLCAACVHSRPFGFAAMFIFVTALLPAGNVELRHHESVHYFVVVCGLIACYGTALASEKNFFGRFSGLWAHQFTLSPYLLYGGAAWLTGVLLVKSFPGLVGAFSLAAAALVVAVLFLFLNPHCFVVGFGAFCLWGNLVFLPLLLSEFPDASAKYTVATLVFVSLFLLGDRYFSGHKQRTPVAVWLCAFLLANVFVVVLCYLGVAVQRDWLMTTTALTGFVFLGYAGVFRSPGAAALSLIIILYVSCRQTYMAYNAVSLNSGLVFAFALAAAYLLLMERLFVRFAMRLADTCPWLPHVLTLNLRRPETALMAIVPATLLLLMLTERIPRLAPLNPVFITLGWFALAAFLLVLSVPLHQRLHRYAGLGVIALSLARLFLIDMKEQDPLLRVAAFAVVGVGLLCISIGYYKWMARGRGALPDTGRHKAD